jgi:di/tricarboxylate transporter
VAILIIVLLGVMFLSDVVNNAVAAVPIAPVATDIGRGLGSSTDWLSPRKLTLAQRVGY